MRIFRLTSAAFIICAALCLALISCSGTSGDVKDGVSGISSVSGFEVSEYNGDNLFTNGLTPFRYRTGEKMGYIDISGKFIIEPKFDTAYPFGANGLARVEVNDYEGFIDISGKYVIEPKFGSAKDFDENGLARAFYEGSHGIIDEKGNWVVEPIYSSIERFAGNGLAAMGKKLSDDVFRYGFIDMKGNEVVAPTFKEAYNFSDGLARVMAEDGSYGYIDESGEMKIEARFSQAGDFSQGLAYVEGRDGKTGYIRTDGSMAFFLDSTSTFSGDEFNEMGFAAIYVYGSPVIIDKTGARAFDLDLQDIFGFDQNGNAVVKTGGKYGVINTAGETVIEPSFDRIFNYSCGYAKFEDGDRVGFIDTAGNVVVEPQFYSADDMKADGYAVVRNKTEDGNGYKYAIIDKNGGFKVNFK